ncbi:MAG TPA: alanine racemase [Saprospiraceae bacterium]|jgi:D-serine deaminase-like pyridoxal phosphate-dependent protein
MRTNTITQPTLILDEQRCLANILRMRDKAKKQNVQLRPHFKTHQSLTVGNWFREAGTDKITVSSVGMAFYFSEDGWNDITIAFPVNILQVEEIAELSAKVKLGLVLVDDSPIEALGKKLIQPVSIWIKIDVGTHRTGLAPHQTAEIEKILVQLKKFPLLQFTGFIGHAGHSYQASSITEVQRTYDQSLSILLDLKKKYLSSYPGIQISLGDTPACSMVSNFGPIDELRPGNYVFYDLMQEEIGSCRMNDIAVAMACPVVAVHPDRKQWIIYGGGIHFSKDFLPLPDGRKCFGRLVRYNEAGWSVEHIHQNPMLISLSQEHGIVQCDDHNFSLYKPGDLTFWLPVHSCLTADIMGAYVTTNDLAVDHYRQRLNR